MSEIIDVNSIVHQTLTYVGKAQLRKGNKRRSKPHINYGKCLGVIDDYGDTELRIYEGGKLVLVDKNK
jgi:hypothetical protein